MFIDFFIIHDKKKRNYHNEGISSLLDLKIPQYGIAGLKLAGSKLERQANREGGRLIRFAFNQFTKRAMNIQNTHPSVLLSRRGVASATSSLRAYLSSPLLSLFIYRQLFVSLLKAICFNLRLNEDKL